MDLPKQPGRVNWKTLGILLVVAAVLSAGLVGGHYARKRAAAARSLREGQAAYAAEDWPQAARQFWRYLQINADDPDVLAKYARAQARVRPLDGDAVQSIIAAYRRLVRFQPDNQEAYEQLARLYAGIRDYDNLAYVARMRLARRGNDLKASVWLAQALNVQHKPDQVRDVLRPALDAWAAAAQRYPEYIDACSLMADLEARSDAPQRYEEALRWLDRAAEYDPNSPAAFLNRARFRRTLAEEPGQDRRALWQAARQDLQHANDLGPSDPRQRLILCDEWMRLGQYEEAAAQLAAVQSLAPQDLEPYFFDPTDWQIGLYLQSAELALRTGDIARAVEMTDRVLADLSDKGQRLPTLPAAVHVYVAAGRIDDADRCFREYQENRYLDVSSSQADRTAGLLEALIARARDNPYREIELLEPITAREPDDAATRRLLAEAYLRTDQPRRAVRSLRQYLALHPDDLEMTRQLLRSYLRLQDWGNVASTARAIESLAPDDREAQLVRLEDTINRAAAEKPSERPHRLEPAGRELDSLARAHPEQIDVWMLRAARSAALEDLDQARRELHQAQAHGADPIHVQMQLARLYVGAGRQDDALAVLREVCRAGPSESRPWIELADLQRTRGQVDQARQTLEAALANLQDPSMRQDVQVKRAVLEILQGDHREGLDLLRSLAAQAPRNIRIRTMLLAVPDVQQNEVESARLIEQIRSVEGDRGLTWRLWQATTWLAAPDWRDRRRQIEANLQRCIEADPGWAAPALLLGQVQEQTANPNRAEAIYRNLLAADPSALEVADRLLGLLQRQGRLSQADEVLRRLDTSDMAISSRRTLVAMETGDLGQAIDELKMRTSHDPRDVQSRVLLAQLVYRQGRDAAPALRYLDEADALSPDSIAVAMTRVIIFNSEGRRDQARAQLDGLVRRTNSPEARQLRASYLAGIGALEEAEKEYLQLADLAGTGAGYQALGTFYAQTHRLDKAIAAWRDGLDLHADDLSLKRSLMKGLLQQARPKETAEATAILSDLETRLPNDPEILTLRAGLLLAEGTPEAAAAAQQRLEQAVRIAPSSIDAHLGLIAVALQRQDYLAARKRAVFAMGINSADSRLLSVRARIELALNNPVMARDLAALALKDTPADIQARDVLVQAALATGDPHDLQAAQSLVTAQLAGKPDDLALHLTDSLLLGSLGKTDQAIAALRTYIDSRADAAPIEALVSLADLHQSKGDFAAADTLLQQAAEREPDSPAVLRGRINWLAAQRQYDPIVSLMKPYASRGSPDGAILEAAAAVLAGSDQRVHQEAALTLYEQACRVAPLAQPYRLGYASLAYRLGHLDQAEAMYRQVLQTSPDNMQALNDLAWLLCKNRHQAEQALELADKAARLAPDNIHVRDTRGEVLASLPGRQAEARREFQTCVDLSAPDSPARARALLRLANLLVKIDNRPQARQVLEQARAIDGRKDVFTQSERVEMEHLLESPVSEAAAQPLSLHR